MKGAEWLDELVKRVNEKLPGVELFRADAKTMSLALGNRVVTVLDTGTVALLAPSFTAGGSIASRLAERVQHMEPSSYDIGPATVEAAAAAVIAHLKR